MAILRRFRRRKSNQQSESWQPSPNTSRLTEQRTYIADVPLFIPKTPWKTSGSTTSTTFYTRPPVIIISRR